MLNEEACLIVITEQAKELWRLHDKLENQLDNTLHLLAQVDEKIQKNHRAFLRTFGVERDED